jgi:peptide-N4-(N-acetyl-beta-glucosaminyl)asparagine amidase
MQQLVEAGSSWKLRKTETHTCPKCGYRLVFPRYAEVLKIAESRTGRCSEWSMLFGAMLSSISMPVRIVQDYLDHCWNEISLDNKNDDTNNNNTSQRWVHVDSTLSFPISLDHPHYYEQNWGKKYLHVLAFDANKVEDVTRRYTEQWDKVTQRREKSDQEGYDEKVFLPENLQALYSAI